MNEIIFMVEDSPDGGYTAEALGQSIFTEAETVPELKANILDAMKCHYDSNVPKIIRLHFVKEEVLQYA